MSLDLDAIRLRHQRYESLRSEPLSTPQLAAAAATAADVPALLDAIDNVRALHTDSVAGVCPSCGRVSEVSDQDDGLVDWPCPTILALDGGAR